ncbi:MAG: selenocysteine-specific translation elongation factor [Coriobacteriales bacterium]|jgi:selenocysteine-specific elongation factor|nr:selenocysteine-specific translation elongation factor [Coriobacteriales bacterium]
MNERRPLIVGTAGHIDHGKSSLIKALTGTDPDRLAEEKRRGITIELGFAQLQLPDGSSLGVVDVPGHERFVRQMIAGATGVDIALLVIAADDGIMPQTKEHLAVVELLGISRCVVALTKADLVEPEWLSLVSDEIKALLQATPFADAPVIPTSIKTQSGFAQLLEALTEAASGFRESKQVKAMRMPVDRVFTIKGSGTVVTGTLWSGTLSPEDELELQPKRKLVRVRTVQVHNQIVQSAEQGSRVAVNLSGVTTDEVRPGDFLVAKGRFMPSDRFDASFTYLEHSKKCKPLESGTRIHLAHGTREVFGRILFINRTAPLSPGESLLVQVRLEEPLLVARGDHFIVRSYSPVSVIGGGEVLRSKPRRKTNLSSQEYALLESLKCGDTTAAVKAMALLRETPFTPGDLALEGDFEESLVSSTLEALAEESELVALRFGESVRLYVGKEALKSSLQKLERLLLDYHTANPSLVGIAKEAFMQRFKKNLSSTVFDALIEEGQKQGILQVDGGLIAHPKARSQIRSADSKTAGILIQKLTEAQTTPPTIQELIKDCKLETAPVLRALKSMEAQRLIVRVSKELCFEASVFESLRDKVVNYLKVNSRAQATELKDALGLSRKYAIPILEYLDAQRITKRQDDYRILF